MEQHLVVPVLFNELINFQQVPTQAAFEAKQLVSYEFKLMNLVTIILEPLSASYTNQNQKNIQTRLTCSLNHP